jgi:hypothetical protein
MNHLIAKTKGKDSDFFKVISDKDIFDLPNDLDNPVKFQADHKLDEDSWFGIDDFTKQDFCIPLLKEVFISTDYNQIKSKDYNNIDYLCDVQPGIFYFQKIGSKQFITKRLLSLNTLSISDNEPIIIINEYADAIYIKNEDRLYFKSLTAITTIFKGIDQLYREATKKETEIFLKNKFIKLGSDYSTDKVKKANRKRIALVMDTLKKFTPKEKKSIFTYIQGYCKDLKFDKKAENFTIDTEEDLKQLLYGIEQRYYTTILGGEKRLANSITTL